MSLLSLLPLSPLPRHHDLGDGAVRRARRHGNPGKERGSGGRDRPTVRDDCDGGGAGAGDGEGSDAPRPRWDPPGAAAPLPRQGSGGLRVSSPELLAGEARRPPEGPLPEPLVQDDGGEGRRSRGGWFSLFRRRSRRCRRCLCCLCCRCCCPLPHRLGGLPSPQKVRGDDRAEEERRRESPPPSSFFSFFSAAAAAGSDKGFRKGPRLRPPRLVERRLGLEDE